MKNSHFDRTPLYWFLKPTNGTKTHHGKGCEKTKPENGWKDDSYLSKLLTSGDDFPLCDPLFQVVDFPVQHEQLEGVVKFGSPLRGQVPQTNVVLLNLSQTHLIARRNENIMLGTVTV